MPGIVGKAIARQSTICLPTYAVRSENRNPVFRSQYGVVKINLCKCPWTSSVVIASLAMRDNFIVRND